jgi:hypothetical protein
MPTPRRIKAFTGQPIRVESIALPGLWEPQNRDPVPNASALVLQYQTPGVRQVKFTAVETVEVDVVAAYAPTPTEPPIVVPPVQPSGHDVIVKPGQSLSSVIQAGGGNKSYGVEAGTYGQLRGLPNNIKIVALGAVKLTGSNDYGIDLLWDNKPGPRNVTFEGLTVHAFNGGARIQHMDIENAPRSQHAQNIVFRQCRFTGMRGTGSHSGHGIFAANVDGLMLEECFIADAGAAGTIRDIWVHGLYSKEGNRGVIVKRCFVVNAENFGLQARGTTWREDDTVTVPGPIFDGNLIIDAVNGIAVDGNNARVTNNAIGVRHFHLGTRRSGWSGVYGSVGTLWQGGNIRFRSAGASNRTDGWKDNAWRNASRSDDVWCRRGPCKTISSGTPDVDAVGKTVDLSDLVARARAGEDVGKLVGEGQARARA